MVGWTLLLWPWPWPCGHMSVQNRDGADIRLWLSAEFLGRALAFTKLQPVSSTKYMMAGGLPLTVRLPCCVCNSSCYKQVCHPWMCLLGMVGWTLLLWPWPWPSVVVCTSFIFRLWHSAEFLGRTFAFTKLSQSSWDPVFWTLSYAVSSPGVLVIPSPNLTLSSPLVSNGYTSKCSVLYWSNPPFLIFRQSGTLALSRRERQSAQM